MGRRVASNVRRLRDLRQLTTGQLAERLTAHGVAMNATAVTKIEKMNRRVTVDELHALAGALGVRTTQLLRDPDADPMSEIAALADDLLRGPFSLEIVADETGVTDVLRRTRREVTRRLVLDRLAEAKEQGRPTMAEGGDDGPR